MLYQSFIIYKAILIKFDVLKHFIELILEVL